ncbi:MAG: Asp-tRNA(Asn)/Glu-tRNA(Gln) amidotransferase subunit GatA [Candidatus Paceibacterota bacterium]|jgi:aspartyl-tRNA(Asn)/glutamyl-tRNA(Gln) amidotransferase subunit A
MKIDLNTLSIKEAHEALLKKEVTVRELAEAALLCVKERDGNIHAYLEIYDDVMAQADAAQKMINEGGAKELTGIPLAIKDNILIKGRKATAASKILEGYTAPYDATVVKKLKAEGVVFIGRTNMDEFAMGGSTENSAFGPTRNPHDVTRVPGGSSGGSAAAVAMGSVLGALGSDTGGSIRQPASLCGVVGLKTTYGRVSRYGLMALGSSLDQIGPFGKTVEDAEIIFKAISGFDRMDSTSAPDDMIVPRKINTKIIGVPRDFLGEGLDEEVRENFEDSIKKLKDLGYGIKDISLPNIKYSLSVYYIIMPAEASTNLSRFDGIRYGLSKDGGNTLVSYMETRGEGFGKEVRRRIMLGAYVLSSGYYDAYYNKANAVRLLITKDFGDAFKEVDAIITPTSPVPAFKIGEKTEDPLAMYLADIFTVPVNIAGIPAISVPSGKTKNGLPLGLQIMSSHFGEDTLFEIGKKFEGKNKS